MLVLTLVFVLVVLLLPLFTNSNTSAATFNTIITSSTETLDATPTTAAATLLQALLP